MSKYIKKAALLLPLILFLTACEAEPVVYQTGFISMDTYISFTVYGENAENAAKAAQEETQRLEALFSVTDPDSEVSKINNSGGEAVNIGTDTASVIAEALRIGAASDGALDITLRPVIKEWGFTTGEYKIPDSGTLAALLEYVDYKAVTLDGGTVSVPKEYRIDLGSVAKGYVGDRTISVLRENGIASALVNLGGNVQTLGTKPDGENWRVAVQNPFGEGNLCVIEISDKAIVTSGNYERYFEDENGTRYHHIIDPKDGYPADNGLVSATIIGESGVECDALSTAVFVMGEDRAGELWRNDGGFEMILVTDEGKMLVTEGLTGCFENRSDMEVEIIKK